MKIYCVRIGDRYGPEYEDYINKKLSDYEVVWIREPINSEVKLQWNKMYPMSLNLQEPVCVIDIDILLVNNYKELFEYPISAGEFIAIPAWWKDSSGYEINGGFFKYYPKECNYIYKEFINNINYWQNYYILNRTTVGPVNGEQYFVEDMISKKLKLKIVPISWVARWSTGYNLTETEYQRWQFDINDKYCQLTDNDYLFLDEFHPDIKLVHFTHSHNKPIEWINKTTRFYK